MKKGTKVRHKTRGFIATVDSVVNLNPRNPTMVKLSIDDGSGLLRWFPVQSLEEIIDKPRRYIYYETTSVVKVDIDEEGWDSGCDETFGLARMTTHPKHDGILDNQDIGAHMVGYRLIEEEDFEKIKHRIFTEEGGI